MKTLSSIFLQILLSFYLSHKLPWRVLLSSARICVIFVPSFQSWPEYNLEVMIICVKSRIEYFSEIDSFCLFSLIFHLFLKSSIVFAFDFLVLIYVLFSSNARP